MGIVTVVELGLLAVASGPGVRLLTSRDLRGVAPWVYATLGGLAAASAVTVIYLAFHAAGWLHPIAILAGVAAGVGWWRGRPSFGRSRGLPPGSLSLASSIEAIVDRSYYMRQYRRYGPVFKMAQFHRGVVCVVGLKLGHELLRKHARAMGPSPQPFNQEINGGFLRYMDSDTHRVYGALFRAAFSGTVVSAAEAVTRVVIVRELTRMAEACERGVVVRPTTHLERIVFAAFARVMFDIEPESEEARELERLYGELKAQPLSRSLTPRTNAALAELRTLVLKCSEDLRRRIDEGGAPTCVLAEMIGSDPTMPDLVCVDNLLFIMKISSSNVVALLHWLLKMLAEQREWLDRVRGELESGDASQTPSLADRMVMETLRLEQSEYIYRSILESFEHDGVLYPRGWLLRLCVKESHRSDEIFEKPTVFDPDRFLEQTFTKSEYSPFGAYRHACNGVELTNMICRVMVEELARGFDCTILQEGRLERDFRHWSHWRPSSKLGLAISPRAAAGGRARVHAAPEPPRSGPSGTGLADGTGSRSRRGA